MSADFKEARFPIEVSAWMVGGPDFNNEVVQVDSGATQRLIIWQYPLHKWDCGAGLREIPNAEATKRFQMRMRGSGYSFRVLDPLDFKCSYDRGVCVPTGAANEFQLVKDYSDDGDVYQRVIVKPIPGTVSIKKNNGLVAAAIDFKTGKFLLSGVVGGDILTWQGLFDVAVRFEGDWLQLGVDSGGLLNWQNAHLVEERVILVSTGTPPVIDDWIFSQAFAGSSSVAPPPAPTVLTNNVAVTGLSGAESDQHNFSFVVPVGAPSLNFSTSGGTGNLGLYIDPTVIPTPPSGSLAFDNGPGTSKSLTRANPTPTTWVARLIGGLGGYSAVSIVASYPPPPAPDTFSTIRHSGGTLSNSNQTLTSAATAFSAARATGTTGKDFGTTVAGYAVEFTIDTAPAATQGIRLLNVNTSSYTSGFGQINFRADGTYAINPSHTGLANPSRAWAAGDKIGLVYFLDLESPYVAFFKNGTLIDAGAMNLSFDFPPFWWLATMTPNVNTAAAMTVNCDLASMTHGAIYKAYRLATITMVDAIGWTV